MSTMLTIGDVARMYGLPVWKVRRLFERGLLPPASRIGAYRVFDESEIPVIEAALRQAGYLDLQEVDVA